MKIDIDHERLIAYLLPQPWQNDCTIITSNNQTIVTFPNEHQDVYLRYSKGPQQGFMWDIYGDNMLNNELALIALSQAPIPINYRKAEYPLVFKLPIKELKS